MKTSTAASISNLSRALDLGALLTSFALCAWLAAGDASNMPFAQILAIRISLQNFLVLSGMVLIWGAILTQMGLYRTYIYGRRFAEVRDVTIAMSLCAAALWIVHQVLNIQLIGIEFLTYFWLLSITLGTAGRLTLRLALRRARRNGRNVRQVLIVGTNPRAVDLMRQVVSAPELGFRLVGFVDEHWAGTKAIVDAGYPIVSDFAGFPDFISRNVVDEVMVCLPFKSLYERSSQIVAQCAEQGITARLVSEVVTPSLAHSHVERFADRLVLTVHTGGMRGWSMVTKRLMDIAIAGSALIVLSPLILVVAALIRARSPGSVFFTQERMGVNKRRFRLYKFRTMVPDAEQKLAGLEHLNEASGPVFKIRNDPRITPVGRFLRKTSIDELPQLINVLIGDMSLVGPRPLPVRDYESFNTAWHRRRFSVKPGITCLWQVMGRSSIPFERWMELDMQYIDQWSLALDLQILLRTIPAVLRGSGAS
jgi:exopolysaccharide biosynthesis polyprenyl glycosylphosphotransferase